MGEITIEDSTCPNKDKNLKTIKHLANKGVVGTTLLKTRDGPDTRCVGYFDLGIVQRKWQDHK